MSHSHIWFSCYITTLLADGWYEYCKSLPGLCYHHVRDIMMAEAIIFPHFYSGNLTRPLVLLSFLTPHYHAYFWCLHDELPYLWVNKNNCFLDNFSLSLYALPRSLPTNIVTCLTSSVLTLSAIACDRFIAILYPLQARFRVTKHRTGILIIIIWITSLIVSIPFLIVRKYYVLEVRINHCTRFWVCTDSLNRDICTPATR